jgi:pseudaminic acid synthase
MPHHFSIDGRRIGSDTPPYVIAELSANHHGRFEHALKMLRRAKEAGADAFKLQTYRPDTITLDSELSDFQIDEGPWKGQSLYALYESAYMPWEWHEPLFKEARSLGMTLFSSPFDTTAVDLLESLNAPAYKIASFEAIDLPLIRYTAATGKPMIISTGLANADEIAEALEAAREGGCSQVALLHCVSGYPAPASDYHLRTLVDMQQRFSCVTGLSDHTLDHVTAIASVALGARIIEKHVTPSRSFGGADDAFSLDPEELAELCRLVRTTYDALGEVSYDLKESEKPNLSFRRSLYFVASIRKGEQITSEHVRSIRPGRGLAPKFLDQVIGLPAPQDFKRGEAVPTSMLELIERLPQS